jgi:cobalt-zinc-cadmium efflux system outer membrane protein
MFTALLLGPLVCAMLAAAPAPIPEPCNHPAREITFDQALELARLNAPELATARARVDEAASDVEASQVYPFNPELEAESGPRRGPSETTIDWSVGATQWFETGGKRRLRREAARAGLDAEDARAAATRRSVLHEVATVFVEALYWQELVALSRENGRIMEEIARVARRRYEVGQTGGLEASLASLALERARIAETRALADLARVNSRLSVLLGLDTGEETTPIGDLREFGLHSLADTPVDIEHRPELQALAAEARRAEIETELGRAGRWPELGLGVNWGREEEYDLVHGHLAVSLPIFDRGQGEAARAHARQRRIETDIEAARQRLLAEVNRARKTCGQLQTAALRFEERGLPDLERSARLARANYDAGAIPLTDLLTVQRELVRARNDFTDLLLDAAVARVDLAAGLGEYR